MRDAFVGSVACTAPPVSFQMSHVSIVPKASFPAFAAPRAPFTFSSTHPTWVPEK